MRHAFRMARVIRHSSRSGIGLAKITIGALAVMAVVRICGCGDFFAQKPTEFQSMRIRRDVGTIRPVSEPNIPIPDIYKAPPKIVRQTVGGGEEWKLFYFCRHHTAGQLAGIVNDQFASKLFDAKGKSTTVADYKVSANPATNQLIVRCPREEDINAVLELLELVDVQPIQVKIDCLISEVYADKTLDWETTLEIGNLLGEDITMGGSGRLFGDDVLKLIQEGAEGTFLPAFPGASLREVARAKMGLKIGYAGANFVAMVDLLESKGYLKILMNPSLEVVNGQKARIESTEKVPLEKTFLYDRDGAFVETKTEYVDVVDALEIIPHVFADGYVGLETTAIIGSKNTPEGVKQIRIVTKREIYNKENRIRQGESLVIGGIRKSEEHSVVRGVPLLKDIPVLGVLFSSKDYEERAVETVFILTPTISTGGIPNKEMVERLRKKHESPNYPKELQQAITDPVGFKVREQERKLRLRELEEQHLEAAREKAKAQNAAREANERARKAEAEAEKAKAEKEKMTIMLEQLSRSLKELELNTQKTKKEAEKPEAEAKKSNTEAEKVEATKASAEADKAETEAQKAKTEAKKA